MNLRPRGAALIVTEPHVIICAISCVPPLIPALVSLPEALLRREALEFVRFAPHLRRLFGIARVRQDFTFRAAALEALQGGAVAADPRACPRQNADVRAAAFIAEPPVHIITVPAVLAPYEIVGFFLPWVRSPGTSPQHTPGTSESGLSSLVTGWRREIIPGAPVFQRWSPWRKVKLVA